MKFIITPCENNTSRVFPVISPEFYNLQANDSELSPHQKVARSILALSNQKFTFWQRYRGWNLDHSGKMGHMLLLHRMAMAAELQAQWERADFFWHDFYVQLSACSKDDLWANLFEIIIKAHPDVIGISNPKELQQRVIHEIFLDTHCAFYNGYVQKAEGLVLRNRAFAHYEYLQKLIPLAGLHENEISQIITPPALTKMTLLIKNKKGQEALNFYEEVLQYSIENLQYQNKLIELYAMCNFLIANKTF